jgi:hypothetical protein
MDAFRCPHCGKDTRLDADAPWPRHLHWFAPWRWSWRARWALLLLLPLAYIEAPVLLLPVTELWGAMPAGVGTALEASFIPLQWAYDNSQIVEAFYDYQLDPLRDLLNR